MDRETSAPVVLAEKDPREKDRRVMEPGAKVRRAMARGVKARHARGLVAIATVSVVRGPPGVTNQAVKVPTDAQGREARRMNGAPDQAVRMVTGRVALAGMVQIRAVQDVLGPRRSSRRLPETV